jgi:hypothetical protein
VAFLAKILDRRVAGESGAVDQKVNALPLNEHLANRGPEREPISHVDREHQRALRANPSSFIQPRDRSPNQPDAGFLLEK